MVARSSSPRLFPVIASTERDSSLYCVGKDALCPTVIILSRRAPAKNCVPGGIFSSTRCWVDGPGRQSNFNRISLRTLAGSSYLEYFDILLVDVADNVVQRSV